MSQPDVHSQGSRWRFAAAIVAAFSEIVACLHSSPVLERSFAAVVSDPDVVHLDVAARTMNCRSFHRLADDLANHGFDGTCKTWFQGRAGAPSAMEGTD